MKRKTKEGKMSDAYEKGQLTSVAPSKGDLKNFKDAATATFIKDRGGNPSRDRS